MTSTGEKFIVFLLLPFILSNIYSQSEYYKYFRTQDKIHKYSFESGNYDEFKNYEWNNKLVPFLVQSINSDDTIVVDYLIGTLANGGRSRQSYIYDKNVNRTSFSLEYWENGEWIPFWLHTYTYDLMGNMNVELNQNWDGTELVNSLRRQFTYDKNGNMISTLYETWNGTQWIKASLYTYTYNFSGYMTSQLYQTWNDSVWMINRRETYTNDFNGNRISELWEIRDGNEIVNYWRRTMVYDSNDNLISWQSENWNSSSWEKFRRYSAIYGSTNNLLSELYENIEENQWRNDQKITYTYDSSSYMISSLFEVWHDYWNSDSRKTYVHDSTGRIILSIGERWWENKWQPFDQWFEVQDSFGNISSTIASTVSYFYSILTSVSEQLLVNPDYTLLQNYPNPFNPSTIIKYSIPNVASDPPAGQASFGLSNITLKIYDILGKEVATLVNQKQSAGNYAVIFNANNLPSGVYFYQLKSSDFVKARKMMLVR